MTHLDLPAQIERSRTSMEFEGRAVRQDYLPNAVGNAAVLGLGEALIGWIVGLDEGEVRSIVERSRDWLRDSVSREEEFGTPPEYFAAVRMEALAVASWALGDAPETHYRDALDLQERAFGVLELSDEQVRDDYLEDYLVDCALAGEYQRGLDACGRYGVAAPADESDLTTPLSLAAWICRARASDPACQPFDPLTAARLLHEPFVRWLSTGRGITAAAWSALIFCVCGPETDAPAAFRCVRQFVGKR